LLGCTTPRHFAWPFARPEKLSPEPPLADGEPVAALFHGFDKGYISIRIEGKARDVTLTTF
jgi:hypothetical protein